MELGGEGNTSWQTEVCNVVGFPSAAPAVGMRPLRGHLFATFFFFISSFSAAGFELPREAPP